MAVCIDTDISVDAEMMQTLRPDGDIICTVEHRSFLGVTVFRGRIDAGDDDPRSEALRLLKRLASGWDIQS